MLFSSDEQVPNYQLLLNKISEEFNTQCCQEHLDPAHKVCLDCIESNIEWKKCIFCDLCYKSHIQSTNHHNFEQTLSLIPKSITNRIDNLISNDILEISLDEFTTRLIDKLYRDIESLLVNQLLKNRNNQKDKIKSHFELYPEKGCKKFVEDLKDNLHNKFTEINNKYGRQNDDNNNIDQIMLAYCISIKDNVKELKKVTGIVKSVRRTMNNLEATILPTLENLKKQIISNINQIEYTIDEELNLNNGKLENILKHADDENARDVFYDDNLIRNIPNRPYNDEQYQQLDDKMNHNLENQNINNNIDDMQRDNNNLNINEVNYRLINENNRVRIEKNQINNPNIDDNGKDKARIKKSSNKAKNPVIMIILKGGLDFLIYILRFAIFLIIFCIFLFIYFMFK